ncbi:type II secretion system secretin GspD [Acidovorax sp. YS12]|nr:type II secretion system secretin GspD [Acidovorax sp. YS12]
MLSFDPNFPPRQGGCRPAFAPLVLAALLAGCASSENPAAPPRALLIERAPPTGWAAAAPAGPAALPPAQRVDAEAETQAQPERITARSTRPAAAPLRSASRAAGDGQRITLNFPNTDLGAVVATLARFTGKSFVIDPRVKGNLTLVSETPVAPDTAYAMLLSALRMQGFAVIDAGGVSRVVPEADAKLQASPVVGAARGAAAPRGGEIVTRIFPVRYESAEALVPVLRPLIAPNNTINAFPGNNSLVITDYADNLDRIAQVIAGIDTPIALASDYIPVRHGVALDVAAIASQLLDSQARDANERVTIVADPRSNALLVSARSPERLELARNLLARIDVPQARAGNLHVVNLRNAQATQLAEVLRGALSGQGSGQTTDTASNALSSTPATTPGAATASGTGTLQQAATQTGARNSTATVQRTTGTANRNASRPVSFTAGGATVQADPTTNTLIISAPPPLYRSIREVIDLLDQRRAQVLVEALVVEVNSENAAQLGVQWMFGGDRIANGGTAVIGGTNLGGSGLSASSATASTIDALGQGLNLGIVRGTVDVLGNEVINLGLLARALKNQSGTNVLSTPNLMTLDNEEASIIVGRRVPFVTGRYTTSGDGASNPFQTVEREDVGLTLRIRPQISEGGTVKLALYQEVSSIDTVASQSAATLVTRKRALETNVLVDDGQIIVLGGLLEDSVDNGTSEVPGLGSLPVVGRLFRYDKNNRTQTNLMVFLRPHIVRNSQDAASLTLDRYNYMRGSQTQLPRDTMSQLLPDLSRTTLPPLQQDPQTQLLDMRGSAPGGASAAPVQDAVQEPAAPAPAPAPVPGGTAAP